jgi:hypothetical protein
VLVVLVVVVVVAVWLVREADEQHYLLAECEV